ncbi:MAG: hypothetical protein K0S33_3813 [Bacteroidetes bacterium]|jgi:nucleotide-binding universal stress UspA family protein|nr:hypothetical protein [Bacteroidota bacterium]
MKTILVPTDFSEASKNAIDYAVEMAKAAGAKLILFHAYHIPPTVVDAALIIPSPTELEEDSMKTLRAIRSAVLTKPENKVLTIECVCAYGFAVDEITAHAEKTAADLVIMGMQGAGWLSEKLFGSITTDVMRKCKSPVLSIPEKTHFVIPRRIVFAYDYQPLSASVLDPLAGLATQFNSMLFILNVSADHHTTEMHIKDTFRNIQVEEALEETEHTFHYRTNEDLGDAIGRFVKRQQADMAVMIPKKHSFLANLFKEPATKQAAFHIGVPLLTLPDK